MRSLAEQIIKLKKLRKNMFEAQSTTIRAYGHLLNKSLESENIEAEVKEVRDLLYEFADELNQRAEEI